MGLKLQTVPAARGLAWVRLGLREFVRYPMAYVGLFAAFMVAALLLSMLPLLGGLLVVMALPLLSLAYMMATRLSLQAGKPWLGIFLVPWQVKQPLAVRRDLLLLCGLYALLSMLAMAVCDWLDGGSVERLIDAIGAGNASADEVAELAADPAVLPGALARLTLTALLGVPLWHAPALLVWGQQGLGQALFSSTLALWRARGAFVLYTLAWLGAMLAGVALVSVLMLILGLGQLSQLLIMPLALMLTSAYYVSLYFTFADSFGEPD